MNESSSGLGSSASVSSTPNFLPVGYICRHCQAENRYPAYVFAHWNTMLQHTCQCGELTDICMGRAVQGKQPEYCNLIYEKAPY